MLKSEKIEIIEQHPLLLDNPRLLKNVLLPLEFDILKYFIQREQPASTREIFNYFIEKLVDNQIKEALQNTAKSHLSEKEQNEAKKTYTSIKLNTRAINDHVKRMRKEKISFHSYEKITNTLEQLESWGILKQRREDSKTKTATIYWYLNPAFILKYDSKFEEIKKL